MRLLSKENILNKELLMKVTLIIIVFCSTFLIFKALQKPVIYNSTLKNVTYTYSRDSVNNSIVWKVDKPYYYIDSHNSCRWDAVGYFHIRDNYYNKNDADYAFFPLFPFVWKISGIGILFIGLFNYLLFGISITIFSFLFLKNVTTSLTERLCVFTVSLTLPPIVIYYIPYADALLTLTFALAVFGLIKNNYWLFFISILLFAMTRPIFAIVGISFIIMDVLYFIKHKNSRHFFKELSLKLIPLVMGTLIVFFMFYLNSGSFMKYFECVNKYWNTHFSIPDKIMDWSIESFGMNVFTIFFIILPSAILFINYFWSEIHSDKTTELQSIFNGNTDFVKTYFFNNALIYFWGVFLYVVFFQAGSLNGLSRYIIASPFFFIFLFYFYPNFKKIKLNKFAIIFIFITVASFMMLVNQPKLDPEINFNDSGFFTLLISLIYLFLLRFMNTILKVSLLFIVAIYNIIWITYLYNAYLCNGWIFT